MSHISCEKMCFIQYKLKYIVFDEKHVSERVS